MKVIIVGGGIAGLALANCLQHTDIEFVLIEKRERLDPQLGASIGILPNGARILDQLGCYDDLINMTVSMESTATHRSDGSVIGGISDSLQLMKQRTGYAVMFIDRQLLLRVLAEHVVDPGRVMLNKTLQSIDQSAEKAVVTFTDGSTIDGDIVVGADGVHSFTRQEMWRHAAAAGLENKFQKDYKAMSAEYRCLFGISNFIEGMEPGQTDRTYAKDMSTLSYVGKNGRVFWFVFVKMDRVYYPPDIPRFTDRDAADLVRDIGPLPIRERGSVCVRDLYENHVACNLVAIEEAEYQYWSHERIVCLGDSIHKMTPNLGAGASSAVESAAVLSNVLVQVAAETKSPSAKAITDAFREYQDVRAGRVSRTMKFSNTLTRVQALKGLREYIFTHYIGPLSDDAAAEMFSSFVIGAPLVEHLPVPSRSMQGTMPFNLKQGWGFEEAKRQRARYAFPLILLATYHILSLFQFFPIHSGPSESNSRPDFEAGFSPFFSGRPIYEDIFYGIVLLESTRLSNKGSLIQLPILFGIAAHFVGYQIIAPLYFFLLYLQSPIESFRALDNRLTETAYTAAVGPFVVAYGMLLRYAFSLGIPSLAAEWLIIADPLPLSLALFVVVRTLTRNTIRYDRLWAVRKDVPWLRWSVGIMVMWSSTYRIYNLYANNKSACAGVLCLSKSISSTMSSENLNAMITGAVWLTLVCQDFRKAGMLRTIPVLEFGLGLLVALLLGPATFLGLGWLWRENIILNRRHMNAMVPGQENEAKDTRKAVSQPGIKT